MPSSLNDERHPVGSGPTLDEGTASATTPAGLSGIPHDPQPISYNGVPVPMRSPTLLHSFRFAFHGIAYAFHTQRNFKIHCAISAGVVVAGVLLQISLAQWTVLAVVIGLVFQTELTNTAVEAVVDRISPEFHELGKVAKDCSAAAVLVTAIAAVIVGALIFGPEILALLGGRG
jgi:diacylglycerol kinase (ATP)